MNKMVTPSIFSFIILFLFFLACRKSTTTESVNTEITEALSAAKKKPDCIPDYGDDIICKKYKGPNKDYTVKPRGKPMKGKFFATPQGLVIDERTGEINVTQSEAGARYRIGFVQEGTQDTCYTELVIGGVTYLDSVHVLSNHDTLALPYFNANPSLVSIYGLSDDTDYPGNGKRGGNAFCEFDDDTDDDNGDGILDEPPPGQSANAQHVRVRTKSGVINLKKSLVDGIFGPNPQNGMRKEPVIYYRLNDCSKKALQIIRVNFIYFERKSDVPANIMKELRTKREQFMTMQTIDYYEKPRPPQIIITRYF